MFKTFIFKFIFKVTFSKESQIHHLKHKQKIPLEIFTSYFVPIIMYKLLVISVIFRLNRLSTYFSQLAVAHLFNPTNSSCYQQIDASVISFNVYVHQKPRNAA